MRSNAARAYSLLFFFSGATGLVYELLWVRILYQAFGSTIQSITTVVAAYMGGLGLGAWLLGRKADRHARPAALYGWLEIAIGAFGLASPFVLSLAHRVYIGAAGALALGGAASVALRFGLAALVLLVPTTLMGGTLPALTKGFMGVERDRLQTSLGRLDARPRDGGRRLDLCLHARAARLPAWHRLGQRDRRAAEPRPAASGGRCGARPGHYRSGSGAVARVLRGAAPLRHQGVRASG